MSTGKSSLKHLPKVTHGFGSAAALVDYKKVNETTSKGDAWIQKSTQPLLTKKKSTKMESMATRKSSPKHLPKVTRGFGSAAALVDYKKVNETTSKGDAWIRKSSQPLLS